MKFSDWKQSILICCTALLTVPFIGRAQSSVDTIFLGNPSFEDIPRAGGSGFTLPIRGWIDCGGALFADETPPDIHPTPANSWGVTKNAKHGATYIGMVVRDNETWESVSQAMSGPVKAGECYAFSVWLCRSEKYISARKPDVDSLYPFTQPAVLRIFGGSSFCDTEELLAESDPVVSNSWKQHTFKFEPIADHRYITLQVFYKTPVLVPYNGHILMDDLSPIIPIPCSEQNLAEVFEPKETPAEIISKPPVTHSPNKPTTPKPPVTTPPTTTTSVQNPRLLTELDRGKLHQGKTIRIERLYFKADSSRIEKESYPVLDEIASFLKANNDIVIEIGGHTNTTPSAEYCNKLSTDRAKSVTEYLIDQGVPKKQLEYKGYGKSNPIIANDSYSRAARAKNQRVEIKVLSVG